MSQAPNKFDIVLKFATYFLSLAEEEYDLLQEKLESDPKLLNEYLDNNKKRQQDWRARQDPERLKAIQQEKIRKQNERKRLLNSSDSLEALLFILGKQVANRKSDLKKTQKLDAIEKFEQLSKALYKTIFDIKEYQYGLDISGKSANPDTLFKLITRLNKLATYTSELKAIHATVLRLLTKLQELSDNYTISN